MAATIEMPIHIIAPQRKIWLNGVSREFQNGRDSFRALQDIHLEVRAGEFLCIVGPSGCGKSTLLHLIAGLDRPSSGEMWLDGRLVEWAGPDRILIFQELGLFPWLTARANVEFGLRMKGMPQHERRERA